MSELKLLKMIGKHDEQMKWTFLPKHVVSFAVEMIEWIQINIINNFFSHP